jgi:hypothetical protein
MTYINGLSIFIFDTEQSFGFFIESYTAFSGVAETSSDLGYLFDIVEVLLVLFLL